MRSRYLPDGSIDYDADRALEILRLADEELARRHQAQQEETLRMTAGDHGEPDRVTNRPVVATAGVKTAFPGMPEDPLKVIMKTSPLDLVPNPLSTTPRAMTADQTRTQT